MLFSLIGNREGGFVSMWETLSIFDVPRASVFPRHDGVRDFSDAQQINAKTLRRLEKPVEPCYVVFLWWYIDSFFAKQRCFR